MASDGWAVGGLAIWVHPRTLPASRIPPITPNLLIWPGKPFLCFTIRLPKKDPGVFIRLAGPTGKVFVRNPNPTETVPSGRAACVLTSPPPGGRRLRKVKVKEVATGRPSLPPTSSPASRRRHGPAQFFVL